VPEFRVVVSNRTEVLVEALCDRLSEPGARFCPGDRERIVVGGRGMAVWLNLEIARRLGIASGIEYLYPKNVVAWALSRLLPGTSELDAYSGERLFWTVLAKLPDLLGEPEFVQLASYLEGDQSGSKRFQLCQRIASTLDEYLTYRPELLERWTRPSRGRRGKEAEPQLSLFGSATADASERWQQRLWKAVRSEFGDAHPALRAQTLEQAPLPGSIDAERISWFGLSTLHPLFLRVLSRLGQVCDVHLYLLNACEPGRFTGTSSVLATSGVIQREFWELLHSN
jgi:exodeoxyribonuclease V gamma subunit